MEIAEKIKHHSPNELRLYKEGVFWVAYEQSAYWLHLQKGYKPTKKLVKCIGQEVVSVGFPNLANVGGEYVQPLPTASEENFKMFRLEKEIVKEEFEKWKESLQQSPPKSPLRGGLGSLTEGGVTHGSPLPCGEGVGGEAGNLLDKLRAFDLSNATPMECMIFLNQLKKIDS